MSPPSRWFSRGLVALLAVALNVAPAPRGFAADATPSSSLTVTLIDRLVERGALTKQDGADLMLLAEADAAEARAQVALAQAALAQANAALARAKAVAGLAGSKPSRGVVATTPVARPSEGTAETGQPPETPAPEYASSPGAAPRIAPEEPVVEPAVPEGTVRVAYVPEVVKKQLREEVRQDVMDQARRENWASPRALPDWVSRFRFFGDLRMRYEGINYPTGNLSGFGSSYWNYNAINTGAPFDYTGLANPPFPNSDQNRSRTRLRARLGTGIDLSEGFAGGLRIATGENNSPVTQNQSLGAAGSGQGGNFSKYALWLDRGFLRYELGGQPDEDLTVSLGRFDNPFFSTNMIWADDLGFDGLATQGRTSFGGEDLTLFFTLGAFPVFNTDLNFASNQPAKFKSNDKWLYAGQLGMNFDLGKSFNAKVGAAYYLFRNIEGRVSSPFLPLTSSDAGDTDATRPAFAQKGNTYIALRDITPDATLNNNGTINQWQYFGLATPFHEMAVTTQFEYNHSETFQVALSGEYVKNLAFNREAIIASGPAHLPGPVNNNATNGTTFGGGNTAWIFNLKLGAPTLQKRWDWGLNFGYRKVETDALIDGFCDSDFGGGGTNVKGFTFGGNLALAKGVWVGVRWLSASEVTGPTFKNDILQVDFNGKF